MFQVPAVPGSIASRGSLHSYGGVAAAGLLLVRPSVGAVVLFGKMPRAVGCGRVIASSRRCVVVEPLRVRVEAVPYTYTGATVAATPVVPPASAGAATHEFHCDEHGYWASAGGALWLLAP